MGTAAATLLDLDQPRSVCPDYRGEETPHFAREVGPHLRTSGGTEVHTRLPKLTPFDASKNMFLLIKIIAIEYTHRLVSQKSVRHLRLKSIKHWLRPPNNSAEENRLPCHLRGSA